MSQGSTNPISDHSDKYNDPRVSITWRGILIAVGIGIFSIVGAAVSIVGRSTKLDKTTQFWGEEVILALQLGERMELRPRGRETFTPVDLSGTPGLGHLRRLLLDERNYDFTTPGEGNAMEDCGEPIEKKPRCIQLRLTDPTAHRFDVVELDLNLETGWVGTSDGQRRIRVLERTLPKLRKYFETTITVQQLRSDFRDK